MGEAQRRGGRMGCGKQRGTRDESSGTVVNLLVGLPSVAPDAVAQPGVDLVISGSDYVVMQDRARRPLSLAASR